MEERQCRSTRRNCTPNERETSKDGRMPNYKRLKTKTGCGFTSTSLKKWDLNMSQSMPEKKPEREPSSSPLLILNAELVENSRHSPMNENQRGYDQEFLE